MSLTRWERRVLREIEDVLDAEEPALAGLLRGRTRLGRGRLLLKLMWASVVLAGVLFFLALVSASPGLFGGAFMVLLVVTPTLWCLATAAARDE